MENITYVVVYLFTVTICLILTIMIIKSLKQGLEKFFETLHQELEVSKFFVRLVILVFSLGGFSAALTNGYSFENANWLTLSWDAIDQIQATLNALFGILIALTVVFLFLELVNRRLSK